MKVTRSTVVATVGTISLVGAIVLLNLYRGAVSSQKLAQADLDSVRATYPLLVKEDKDTQAQLTQLEAGITAQQNQVAQAQDALRQAQIVLTQAKAKFPTEAPSITYDEMLLAFAAANKLEVLELKTADEKEDTKTNPPGFKLESYSFSVQGDVASILSLLDKTIKDPAFRSGQMGGVSFDIPLPVTQAEKDDLTVQLRADLLARTQAGITNVQRLGFIEQGLLELLNEPSKDQGVDEMTRRILNTMSPVFGQEVSARLAGDIARALQEDIANQLIDDIAKIYGDEVGKLFTDGNPELTPAFQGVLGPVIIAQLQKIPTNDIPGIVKDVITKRLEAGVTQRIAALVDYSSVAPQVASYVAEKEKPSATIVLKVFVYQGV